MMELALTLADYLIKLLQKREDNVDEYFESYVLPAYEVAEKVYSDYLNLLSEIEKKIERREHPRDLIKFLEEGRVKYLPLRMRIRAEITSRFSPFNDYRDLPEFERGILGVLMGGMAPFEDTEHSQTPYYRSHTLLDILYKYSTFAVIGRNADDYLYIAGRQKEAINRAWEDVVAGFAKYKMLAIPTPSNKKLMNPKKQKTNLKRMSYKREGD